MSRALNRSNATEAEEHQVEVLEPQDVFSAFRWVQSRNIRPALTILDPWYNKGVGGVIDEAEYETFIDHLLEDACATSSHVYLWGFPEILAPFVRRIPTSHRLVAWLTWYYKNNPSVIRGWRS